MGGNFIRDAVMRQRALNLVGNMAHSFGRVIVQPTTASGVSPENESHSRLILRIPRLPEQSARIEAGDIWQSRNGNYDHC
jgi:hypothetical protein